jgi:hypothetical protein
MNYELILAALRQPLEAYHAGTGHEPDETVLRAYQEVYKQVVRNYDSRVVNAQRLKRAPPAPEDMRPHMDLLDQVVNKRAKAKGAMSV